MVNPLAVMVDLGWPWWVTSLIAASVVVVTCAVALLARRLDVRAVAAVLAIEGVAIAVIAPFVMQENASGRSAMHASPSAMHAASLTRAEFARRADANCEAVDRFNSTFKTWPKATELAATARVLDRWIPFFNKALGDQARLRPPANEQSIATAWMHSMTAIGHANQTVRDSAKAGDIRGVRAGYKASDAAVARSTTLSKQLGLKVCFS